MRWNISPVRSRMMQTCRISKKSWHDAPQDHIWVTWRNKQVKYKQEYKDQHLDDLNVELREITFRCHIFTLRQRVWFIDWQCIISLLYLVSLRVFNQEWTPTFTGGSRNLELVQQATKLLSDCHGTQKTLIVQEVLLTPLRTLLMLQNVK